MFDKRRLQDVLVAYKEHFAPTWWEDERYKWEAIKTFQDNWKIDANDFAGMLERALSGTKNLLASNHYFPAKMASIFAQERPDEVRRMFENLFDDRKDLVGRFEEFKNQSAARLEECASFMDENYGESATNSFQNETAISIYLWLRYPDKYYIYKFREIKTVSDRLGSNYHFKQGAYSNNVRNFYAFYNEICDEIQKDAGLKGLLQSHLTKTCYPDPECRTLTMDVCYYIATKYSIPNDRPKIWKISHGTDATGIEKSLRDKFAERNVVVVHSLTKPIATTKTSQGDYFKTHIKGGDFFYLCYGNSIQLLGQFIGDDAVLNEEMPDNWYERKYKMIAQSKDTSAYNGEQKWWSPNYNSTCVPISKEEQGLFEKLILKPYFDITIDELLHPSKKYTKESFLAEVFMDGQKYDKLVAVLRNKKNIILQGAPGVGKTFAAKRLAYSLMGEKDDSRIEFVQFHQNYSYEDFMMGYKPSENGFEMRKGVFNKFCIKASNQPDKDFFFIIDEINRGNMSKIFGELLMMIENDYRGVYVTLAYDEIPFAVPKNLYIIGMMNTADRSLAMIDYALRRRFSFVEMAPAFDTKGFKDYQNGLGNEMFNKLIEKVKELNEAITNDNSLGKGFCIGHSYFSNWEKVECTPAKMLSVVEFDIVPMLEEYWFDDNNKVQQWSDELRKVLE